MNNPFGEGKVEVDDLDFTAKPAVTATADANAAAGLAALPGNLDVGTWVEIREDNTRVRAKLSFVTPLKTRYLFVNRQGKKALECSRIDLARRFQLGEVVIVHEPDEAPLFERLMGDLVNKLGKPAKQG